MTPIVHQTVPSVNSRCAASPLSTTRNDVCAYLLPVTWALKCMKVCVHAHRDRSRARSVFQAQDRRVFQDIAKTLTLTPYASMCLGPAASTLDKHGVVHNDRKDQSFQLMYRRPSYPLGATADTVCLLILRYNRCQCQRCGLKITGIILGG